jgi:hypothetical protein
MTFTDFMGHKDLGEKTVLFMIDAFFAAQSNSGIPLHLWQMAPFSNDWPSSLFMSQDGVAIDAVALDFYLEEFPQGPKDDPDRLLYCDKYLEEAASIGNPPSGTAYDPEQDGSVLKGSLGVLEHWNNAIDKQYSRNISPDGKGIELLYSFIGSGPDTLSLSVINGTGSGIYPEKTVVTVSADPAPEGQMFDRWTGNTVPLEDIYDSITTFIMPTTGNQTITATYRDIVVSGDDMILENHCNSTDRNNFRMDASHSRGGNDNWAWFAAGDESDAHLFMYFRETSLKHTGDKLTLSMLYKSGSADGLNTANSTANTFRLGLFNNNDAKVADISGISNPGFAYYTGYYGGFGIQSDPEIFKRITDQNSLILDNAGTSLGTGMQDSPMTGNEPRTMTLSIEKTVRGNLVTFTNDYTGSFRFSLLDSSDIENTFNTLAIGIDDTPELLDWLYIDRIEVILYRNDITAIQDYSLISPEVKVYPNPASKYLSIELDGNEHGYDIIIYGVSGRKVAEKRNINTQKVQFNCEGWENGPYLFQIVSNKMTIKSGILLIEK